MNHGDYRVAWICPLAKERSAAVSLLDDIHPTLSPRDGDSNIYTYGRMGKHNVVIAHLPSGSSGNGHAARLAVRLKNTFRNIEFSFLVGIGGGAPSREHDIRLGDIVVSHPHRQSGGVIQYDHGKALPGNEIEITGSLNRPSDALLSAVAKLDSDYRCRESRVMEILSESIEKNPRRLEACIYPGSTYEDRLFSSNYPHQRPDDADCNWCDKRWTISRPPRYDNAPIVHYGLIASGDLVIKDAEQRDRLRRKLDVLCFEMEAAGLVNDFNCLVIRGICDYADSHKNDHWQDYAAAVAAAYTRELLDEIPPHVPESRSPTSPREDTQATYSAESLSLGSSESLYQQLYPSRLRPQQLSPPSRSPTPSMSGPRPASPSPPLFTLLGTGPDFLAPNEYKPWQYLTLKSYHIYEKIYATIRRPDGLVSFPTFLSIFPPSFSPDTLTSIWLRLSIHREPADRISYPSALFLATLHIAHVELAHPSVFLKVDPTRRAILTRFDHWIGCQCKDSCGRRWNFVNERGLCDGEDREGQGREECEMVKVWRGRKVWGEKGKRERWQEMKKVWYMS
ncbi:nucleoside phosphorylase domain-containing protein [Elsinoe ampelina]|uniref:Nucleoside phosphorylase domain-containing protein n=1 Tax=Elsinoe ampelina TaxID=302913 RepID=A0A6A6G374_9PEZI|nr:nucleoside phosphorylase domain-containing protein [Elsinoe ampelina]